MNTDNLINQQSTLDLWPIAIGIAACADRRFVAVNQAFLDLTGYSRRDIIGKTPVELGLWCDPEAPEAFFARQERGEHLQEMPCRLRGKDGVIKHVRYSAVEENRFIFAMLRDVTREVLAAREKDVLEKRLELALSIAPISLFHQDVDLRYSEIINPQIPPRERTYAGSRDQDLLAEEDAETLTTIKRRILASGQGERWELAVGEETGPRWFDVIFEPEKDESGTVTGLVGAALETTEHKERELKYRMVLEDQTELISRYRPDHVLIYANEIYCRFFGKKEKDIVGRPWQPVAHPDDIRMVEAKIRSISRENPVVTIENRVYSGAGHERWMQFINRGFFDANGVLMEIQAVGRDITDRKLAEIRAKEYRQRLNELLEETDRRLELQRKEIAREIHDEIGSSLTAMRLMMESVKGTLPPGSETAHRLDKALATARAAGVSIRSICNQLRPPALDDLGLTHTCRWYLRQWSALTGIEVKGRFSHACDTLPEQLSTALFRVLQELLNNVARHSGASLITVSLTLSSSRICFKMTDNGCGFAPEREAQGLGLLGVRERMARYGGQVGIASNTLGTEVRIVIPDWHAA